MPQALFWVLLPCPLSQRFPWGRRYYYHQLQIRKLRHGWPKWQNLGSNPSGVAPGLTHDHNTTACQCNSVDLGLSTSHPKFSLGAFPLVRSLLGMPFSFLSNPLSFTEPPSMEKELSLYSVLCSSPSSQLWTPFFSLTLGSLFSTMGILLSSSQGLSEYDVRTLYVSVLCKLENPMQM